MGNESRALAEERFDVHAVNLDILSTLGLAPAPAGQPAVGSSMDRVA
jgi:hypothetical protein